MACCYGLKLKHFQGLIKVNFQPLDRKSMGNNNPQKYKTLDHQKLICKGCESFRPKVENAELQIELVYQNKRADHALSN